MGTRTFVSLISACPSGESIDPKTRNGRTISTPWLLIHQHPCSSPFLLLLDSRLQIPWGIPCEVALPCATQNELHEEDAKQLLANGY